MAITSAHKTKQVVLHQPQTKPMAITSAKFGKQIVAITSANQNKTNMS